MPRIVRFGPFELDLQTAELRKHGVKIRLHEQPFRILMMLLNQPGEVVSRDELRKVLWPNDTVVEFEHSINAAIQRLRDALGDSASDPRYVETLPRRGYRFVGTVEAEVEAEPRPVAPLQPVETPRVGADDLTGKILARYRIVGKLGEGGMGVVYRATDTKLGRDVAIKFLPHFFTEDEERMAGFSREAKVLASLNHPNIAQIYGEEDRALVMELVPGATLKGPLPLHIALNYAKQIAEALEAAHEKGIVHRDLKPANVMVTPEGVVKLLDFGLAAVARGSNSLADDPMKSPTISMHATQPGVILGTAAYMSPEQAAGKPVDKRADVWSFGVVLWEMITGRRLFEGETISLTLAGVLHGPIDFDRFPPTTPSAIRDLLRRCLDRNAKNRLRDIGEARIAIEAALACETPLLDGTLGRSTLAASVGQAFPFRRMWEKTGVGWIAAGMFAIALVALAIVHFRQAPPEVAAVRFTIFPPDGTSLENQLENRWPEMAVSPDGRRLAFIAYSGTQRRIWVRPLDAVTAHPLAGTEGAWEPFWSPDNRFLGFFVDRQLKKIDANGGPVLTLCDLGDENNNFPGAWSREGVILFSRRAGTLLRVPASGGAATPATQMDEDRKEATNRFPWFLPDGRHFLYAAGADDSLPGRLTIRAGSLDSSKSKVLFEADSNAVYSQGHLLFLRDGNLLAQPFDARRLATAGDAVPAAERVGHHPYSSQGIFSLSDNGVLVYQVGIGLGKRQLSWLDRSGNNLGPFGDPGDFGAMYLSPDGKHLGVGVYESNTGEIWLYDVARGVRTRFAPGPGRRVSPIWSPDGQKIVFSSDQGGPYDLYRKAADGSAAEELLYADTLGKDPTSWSPDGRFLIYDATNRQSRVDLWLLPLTREQPGAPLKPILLQQQGYDGQFSPDGRWVAYGSTESGKGEIYVAAFRGKEPLSGKKWQVSTAGGYHPRWRRDGKEIFFEQGKVMAAEVSVNGDAVEIGKVHELFGPVLLAFGYPYEVSADGQRFLAAVPNGQPAAEPLTVVENWMAGLNK